MAEEKRSVKVSEAAYQWITYLAKRSGRTIEKTIEAMAFRTEPEDLGAMPERKRPESETRTE